MLSPLEFRRFLFDEAARFYYENMEYYNDFGDFMKASGKLQVTNLNAGDLSRIFECIIQSEVALTEIFIRNVTLSADDIAIWAEYLQNHALSHKLKTLKFTNIFRPEDEVVCLFDSLVGHPSIEMIRFGDVWPTTLVFAHVAKVLDSVPTLIDLDINFCKFHCFPPEFTNALKKSRTLQRLTFYECSLTTLSCMSLSEILLGNKYLEFLDIGKLFCCAEFFKVILWGIAGNSTLKYLLADPPLEMIFEDSRQTNINIVPTFELMLGVSSNLLLHQDHDILFDLFTEEPAYRQILRENKVFCEKRDAISNNLVHISRKLLLFDLPLEIGMACLEIVMENSFRVDYLKMSNVLLDRTMIGQINASDSRKLIQSCYL